VGEKTHATITELAQAEHIDHGYIGHGYIGRILRLTLLAPAAEEQRSDNQ